MREGEMKFYPYELPASVLKQMTAILSAVEASYQLSGTYGRLDSWQVMVVDKPKFGRFYTPRVPIKLDAMWGVIYLPWVPSKSIICRLVVHRYSAIGSLSVVRPLDHRIVNGSVVLLDDSADIRRIVRDARSSIREQFYRINRNLNRRGTSHTIRLNPESAFTDVPFGNFDHGDLDLRPGHNGFITVQSYYREYSSVRTPEFELRRREHTLPVNPHHVYMWRTRDSGFRETFINESTSAATGRFGAYTSNLGTSEYGPTIPSCDHLVLVRNKAIAKLIDKSKSGINNIAQDFIQMNQTTALVANTIDRLSSSMNALRAKDFTGAVRQLWNARKPQFRHDKWALSKTKTLAENWLELQYGWKPLLEDVRESIAGWKRFALPNRSIQTIYASASKEITERSSLSMAGLASPVGSVVIKTRSRVKFSFRYRLEDPLLAFLSQTGFTNPVNLAWEILPYSFVVDWFLPIGPFLENLSSWRGLVFLDGSETKFTRQECDFRAYYVGPLSNTYPDSVYTTFGTLSRDSIRLDRSVLTDFPTLAIPRLKSPISTTHVLNGLALLRAAFKA